MNDGLLPFRSAIVPQTDGATSTSINISTWENSSAADLHIPWITMYTVTVTLIASTVTWNCSLSAGIAGRYTFAVSGLQYLVDKLLVPGQILLT